MVPYNKEEVFIEMITIELLHRLDTDRRTTILYKERFFICKHFYNTAQEENIFAINTSNNTIKTGTRKANETIHKNI